MDLPAQVKPSTTLKLLRWFLRWNKSINSFCVSGWSLLTAHLFWDQVSAPVARILPHILASESLKTLFHLLISSHHIK